MGQKKVKEISADEIVVGSKHYISFEKAAKDTGACYGAVWRWTRTQKKYKIKNPIPMLKHGKRTYMDKDRIDTIGHINQINTAEDITRVCKKFFYDWDKNYEDPFSFDELPSGQKYLTDKNLAYLIQQVKKRGTVQRTPRGTARRTARTESTYHPRPKPTKKQSAKEEKPTKDDEDLEFLVEVLETAFDKIEKQLPKKRKK